MKETLAAILCAVIIILVAGESVAGDLDLWRQVQDFTTREMEGPRVASEVFAYLHERVFGDLPSIKGFAPKENAHMRDVKRVFRILEGVLILGLWVFLALFLVSERRASIIVRGSCLAMMLLLGLLVIPYDAIFVAFHQVFFAPGTWTFEGGLMISSFPGPFFAWLAQIWWLRAFTASLAHALISFVAARKSATTTLI